MSFVNKSERSAGQFPFLLHRLIAAVPKHKNGFESYYRTHTDHKLWWTTYLDAKQIYFNIQSAFFE